MSAGKKENIALQMLQENVRSKSQEEKSPILNLHSPNLVEKNPTQPLDSLQWYHRPPIQPFLRWFRQFTKS